MCTLTVFKVKNDFLITMSRDESVSRSESGLSYFEAINQLLFPTDGRSGGTWFGTNENKITMCLLNRYQDTNLKLEEGLAKGIINEKVSRGKIIPQALTYQSYTEVVEFIQGLNFQQFDPFDLVIIAAEASQQVSWNGTQVSIRTFSPEKGFMLTSSSVDTTQVLSHRQKLFEQWLERYKNNQTSLENILTEFHLQRDKQNTSWSVFMDREATHTKSITQVEIMNNQLELKYYGEDKLSKLRQGAKFDVFDCEKRQLSLLCHSSVEE